MKSPENIWKLVRWARSRSEVIAITTPILKDPATNVEYVEAQDKARLLKVIFFPTPLDPDLQDIRKAVY
jgi:hypothetical protein